MKAFFGKNISITIICIILGVIMTMQFKSIHHYQAVSRLENATVGELKDQIINQTKKIETLTARNNELESEINKYQNNFNERDTLVNNLKTELEHAQMVAGLVPVKGKGIIIELKDNEYEKVREDHILDVVNELRASDAQAISINDKRIMAMSGIRLGAGYIIVNGEQILSPYTIKAIADPQKMEHSIEMLGGLVDRLTQEEFLTVDVKKSDNIEIPKIDESLVKIDLLNIPQ